MLPLPDSNSRINAVPYWKQADWCQCWSRVGYSTISTHLIRFNEFKKAILWQTVTAVQVFPRIILDKVLHRKHQQNMSAFSVGMRTKYTHSTKQPRLGSTRKFQNLPQIFKTSNFWLNSVLSLYNRAVAEQAQKGKQNTIDNLSRNIALAELLT